MKENKNENQQEKEQKELEKLIDEVIKENQEALEELAKKKNKRVVKYSPLFLCDFFSKWVRQQYTF